MILDTGYVLFDDKRNTYLTAHAGLYRTEKGAQKQCDREKRWRPNLRVVKVNLVIVEEQSQDA